MKRIAMFAIGLILMSAAVVHADDKNTYPETFSVTYSTYNGGCWISVVDGNMGYVLFDPGWRCKSFDAGQTFKGRFLRSNWSGLRVELQYDWKGKTKTETYQVKATKSLR